MTPCGYYVLMLYFIPNFPRFPLLDPRVQIFILNFCSDCRSLSLTKEDAYSSVYKVFDLFRNSYQTFFKFLYVNINRLYGSYEEITAGLTADSFMNLTGGVAEMIDFRKKRISSERLFQRLHNAFQCPTTMVGCAVPVWTSNIYLSKKFSIKHTTMLYDV